MKFVFALGLLVLYMHICSPEIIPIPGRYVKKPPKPYEWGECFRNNEIPCDEAGITVQFDGEKCVDCVCDGPNEGVTCCMMASFPIVCHKPYCDVRLDTDTCTYNLTRKPATQPSRHVKMWKKACHIIKYEIADLDEPFIPDNPKFLSVD